MKTAYLFFMLNFHQPNTQKVDLHLPKIISHKTSFDVKFIMKENYFFQGEIVNWSSMAINAKFVFPTQNMRIAVNLRLPAIINNWGIFK